ncbi:MAG TPA: hypothetical protein VNX01_03810 [Bacteroidia bacterium]|jgi:hypothetical protein|nr:hypothetical protein [Bacteroidia bacterium]
MATNNTKSTPNSLDGEFKENVDNASQVPHDSTPNINEPLAAVTGGQVKGGVVAQSAGRMESENEDGTATV